MCGFMARLPTAETREVIGNATVLHSMWDFVASVDSGLLLRRLRKASKTTLRPCGACAVPPTPGARTLPPLQRCRRRPISTRLLRRVLPALALSSGPRRYRARSTARYSSSAVREQTLAAVPKQHRGSNASSVAPAPRNEPTSSRFGPAGR